MKRLYKSLGLIILIVPSMLVAESKNTTDGTDCNLPAPQTMFLDRPQGLDSAVFFNPFYYECCDNHNITWYWLADYRYRGTWDSQFLAPCLFQSSKLVFAGSEAGNLNENELVADYIGMAPGTRSTLCVKPQIQNHIFDFFTRFDLCNISNWFGNTWVALGTSLAYSNWNLKAHAITRITNDKFAEFPECYMGEKVYPSASSLERALKGNYEFGDMKTPWDYGKWKFNGQSKTRLANIDLFIGDDIIREKKFHVGLFLKTSAPTGNRPDPEFIFNPVVGNGHHWEFGGGLDSHWTFYNYDDECFQLYLTGSITHLFKDTQWRTFDFKTAEVSSGQCLSGALSRYILLEELNSNNEYNGNIINAVNYTTREIKSSFGIQGDATFRLQWRNNNWAVGLGYNVFGRSAESLSGSSFAPADSVKGKNYGIKGTNGTCARVYSTIEEKVLPEHIELTATQSQTRMSNIADQGINIQQQSYIDHPKDVTEDQTFPVLNWNSPIPPTNLSIDEARKSDRAVPVTKEDLLLQGIPALITHKAFLNIAYQFDTCCHCWQPFIGVGAEVEFGQRLGCSRLCFPGEECDSCEPRFWSIWLQGGMNF